MDWDLPYLDDERKSLVMLMKEFCEREVDIKSLNELADKPMAHNATWSELRTRVPWDLISKAHDAGVRQLPVPEEYDGGGYESDWITLGALAETAGYYGGQMGRIFTIIWKQIANMKYWPKPLQEEVYPVIMKDRTTLIAASLTEPDHGSDILLPYDVPGAAGKFFARQEGDEWILNGQKMWCEAGGVANYIVLHVRTDPKGPLTKSITTFLIPANTPGWSIRVNDMMGNEVFPNVQQLYENVRIPDRLRISPVNEGYQNMRSRFAELAIHFFAIRGWAERTLDDMKEYAKTRIQGGRPIIQHINVGTMIAEADACLRMHRYLLYQNAWRCRPEAKTATPLEFFYLSWYCKKLVTRLVEIGMEVYGGMGPQKELVFEHWVRVHLSGLHGGSTGVLNLVKAANYLSK